MLREILANRITAISGSRDAGKTHVMSRYSLTDYFCFPNDTLILMTSTDLRGLQLRVWGSIKDLWSRAKERHPWLPGHILESMHGIFTDELTEETPVRDIRRGIIGIPVMDRKGAWSGGLQKFCGIKQKRRRLLGDEVQFCHQDYLDVLANLDKGDFKGVFVGNALANLKALDKISEPVEGWGNHPDPTKTEVFKNRYGGVTITLVGTDSPNFDVPRPFPSRSLIWWIARMKPRWRRARQKLRAVLLADRRLPQAWPVRASGIDPGDVREVRRVQGGRVARRQHDEGLCLRYGLRRRSGRGRLGRVRSRGWRQTVFNVHQPSVIPISVDSEPEDQIALYIRRECGILGIEGGHVYYDAGMKATRQWR